jgi:hypothetical protein
MTPTYLYLKQHNKTGLKYFGKTIKDPNKYKGSGVYWNRHLDLHGDDVATVWIKLFTDEQELTSFALEYSKNNNIVESNEYANLKLEDGLMGGDTGLTEAGRKIISEKSKKYRHSKETLEKIRNARANQTNLRTGQKHSPETISKIKAARANQKNVKGIIRV